MSSDYVSLIYRPFRLQKRGNRLDEYEDACAGDATLGRFAIADGATESSFAGQWRSCWSMGL